MPIVLSAQDNYSISLSPVSTTKFDEYSPILYKGKLVYISNNKLDMLLNAKTAENKNPSSIVFYNGDTDDAKKPKLFAKELTSTSNDGPVTFPESEDVIYFSSNIVSSGSSKEKDARKSRLGIFYSEYINGEWSAKRAFRFNEDYYSVTMPAISPDGKRLYFVSDKPNGYGGTDIYYCDWKNGYWDTPINIGDVINTPGNEVYPYVNASGELFFSSDGHGGRGGKDIFFTAFVDSAWLTPVALESPINSEYDDFGIVMDETMDSGYFSSKRNKKSVDIYEFKTIYRQHFISRSQLENNYVFRFVDDGVVSFDTAYVSVLWDFGDGQTTKGIDVIHAFEQPGIYTVAECLYDKTSGRTIMKINEWSLEINQIEQPYITSVDRANVGETVSFDASESYIPSYNVLEYYWDMGDGTKVKDSKVSHSYASQGVYRVKLGIMAKNKKNGNIVHTSVYKDIAVGGAEINNTANLDMRRNNAYPLFTMSSQTNVTVNYAIANELHNDMEFGVLVTASPLKFGATEKIFENLRSKYYIEEIYNEEENLYYYYLGEVMDFMNAYWAFRECNAAVFMPSVVVRDNSEGAKRELFALKSVYSNSSSEYFQSGSLQFIPAGQIYFNQIALMLKNYPDKKLLIECHTNEMSTESLNRDLSVNRAQAIGQYLISKGVSRSQIVSRGFGQDRSAYDVIKGVKSLNIIEFYILDN